MDKDPVGNMFSLLRQRQTQGPALIILGCLFLYFIALRASDTSSPILYGFAVILGIVVFAGIIMTFRELRGNQLLTESEPLPESSSELEHAITQLSKNYEILRNQTTQGFILAAAFMILGLLMILSGSVGEFFGLVENGGDLASIAG